MSGYVDALKNPVDVHRIFDYLMEYDPRYGMLWKFGCNTILRISDILKIKYDNVVKNDDIVEQFTLRETKTGKIKTIYLNAELINMLRAYISTEKLKSCEYLFYHSKHRKGKHLDRKTVWKVLKRVGKELGIKENIGTHTMRKSYAYKIYSETKDIALVIDILNHTDVKSTLSYLGITRQKIAETYRNITL